MDDIKETIKGIVSAVVFRNEENGYSVIKLEGEGEPPEEITAVGCLPDVFPGESILLSGHWAAHPNYGQQFKAEEYERQAPSGADAIFRYLASGVIKGIGPGRAREIVNKFGENALQIIESSPEKLATIRGISMDGAKSMAENLRQNAGVRLLLETLSEYNITPLTAMKLFRSLGESALDFIMDNPYIIAESVYGAQFFEADKMAMEMGFDAECPERLEAALVFTMRHNLGNGHVFIPTDKLIDAAVKLIRVSRESLEDVLDAVSHHGEIRRDRLSGVDVCYLVEMQEAEVFIAEKLLNLAASSPEEIEIDGQALVYDVERAMGLEYAQGQIDAIKAAASGQIMVLTGGPGTGKTTAVRGILELFDKLELKTLLCAPTGRAAKRMGELADRDDAMTVHRALGAGMGDEGDLVFERGIHDPLKVDAVIVDEASMLDLPLTYALLSAISDDCRLVLVGDANQLPSVGPGNVFSDIIKSGAVPVVHLTEIFRQAKESGIVHGAHKVNEGVVPLLSEKYSDMFFLKRSNPQAIADTIAELISIRLPKNMGIEPSQIQALSPTRKGPAGTAALNERLQQELNPPEGKREKPYGSLVFREGDRVMQIRNDYDIIWQQMGGNAGTGVYNGDLGEIRQIDFAAETLTVDFDDKTVDYSFEQLIDLEPAYAMTVHKSQGSEYKAVILALPTENSLLSTRSVLYTAITRAKELLIIVGSPRVFEKMIENDKRRARYSGLRIRLSQGR